MVRQGSIPHGTSIMGRNVLPTFNGGPKIQAVDSTPFTDAGPITNAGYLEAFLNPQPLPPGPSPDSATNLKDLVNPNLALLAAIAPQTIVETVVLSISTAAVKTGVMNIPFVDSNAQVTKMEAIFWIEKVQQSDGTHFMQLQYTQTVILFFKNISWPHISVATLVKQ